MILQEIVFLFKNPKFFSPVRNAIFLAQIRNNYGEIVMVGMSGIRFDWLCVMNIYESFSRLTICAYFYALIAPPVHTFAWLFLSWKTCKCLDYTFYCVTMSVNGTVWTNKSDQHRKHDTHLHNTNTIVFTIPLAFKQPKCHLSSATFERISSFVHAIYS